MLSSIIELCQHILAGGARNGAKHILSRLAGLLISELCGTLQRFGNRLGRSRIGSEEIQHCQHGRIGSHVQLLGRLLDRAAIAARVDGNLCRLRDDLPNVQIAGALQACHLRRSLRQRGQDQARLRVLGLCIQAHQAIIAIGRSEHGSMRPVHRLAGRLAIVVQHGALL